MQTYWRTGGIEEVFVRNILPSMCLRFSQLSQLSFMKYIWDSVSLAYQFLLWWMREYVYWYVYDYRNQIVNMNH